ncbi:hypothetical protein Pla52o_39290 [Novipirellula galeiformis]|uniref:Uncharacterized protein n=1 Tax=Novipirellula galeiformis TaxID=2528004 RepID=A0A5C6CCB8_9BACT|nr:HEPN domain-containing protein [Novipirellula galeiformis]TWU21742.1 hypothetical protein Pla52o_39290 [Novipirellula galeiformis]
MESKNIIENHHDGNWHILLAGMPSISSPMTLAPGITLQPIADKLSIFDLAAAGSVGFGSWTVLEPIAAFCNCEIESAKDSDLTPGYDTLNRAWLASSLMVLRGFSRHFPVACSAYSWNEIAGHQKRTSSIFQKQIIEDGPEEAVNNSKRALPRFHGNLLDYHLHLVVDRGSRVASFAEEDAQWIRDRFESFNRLASESESFRFALESCIDWRYAKDPRSAVARLWSGIEAVLGISSELVYRISLLSASLLTPRGEDRKQKFHEVKKLYGLRSKAVHGEKLTDEKLGQAVDHSFLLLVDLLLLSIERGHALSGDDFDEAVFG